MAHVWISHVTHTHDQSCHTYTWISQVVIAQFLRHWVMSHVWKSRATYTFSFSFVRHTLFLFLFHMCDMTQCRRKKSCDIHFFFFFCIHQRVRHTRTSHGTHVWTSHVTRMHESCHTHEWVRLCPLKWGMQTPATYVADDGNKFRI